jgi:putative DNA primase/helicase
MDEYDDFHDTPIDDLPLDDPPSDPRVVAFARPYGETDPNAPSAAALIEFTSREGKLVQMLVPAGDLTANPRKVHLELGNRGCLFTDAEHGKRVVKKLAAESPDRHILVTKVPGWHGEYYAFPDEWIYPGDQDAPDIHFDRNSQVKLGAFVERGNLEDWRKEVASAAKYSTRIRLMIALAFAAAILWLLKGKSFGLVIMGMSSKGKTLCLRTGASVAGLLGVNGLATFNGSLAAVEQQLLGHRDAFCPLDEIGAIEGSAKAVSALLKTLAFGIVGGGRRERSSQYEAAVNAVKADTRFIVGMTSEKSLAAIAQSADTRRARGEGLRILEIPAYGPHSTDVLDTAAAAKKFGTDVGARGRYAEALERACEAHQGVAQREFLRRVVNDPRATAKLEDAVRVFSAEASAVLPMTSWERRLTNSIAPAYAAAVLAAEYGILPWKLAATREALLRCLTDIIQHHRGFDHDKDGDARNEPTDDELVELFLDHVKSPVDLGKKADWLGRNAPVPNKPDGERVLKVKGAVKPLTRLLAPAAAFKAKFPPAARARLLKALKANGALILGPRADANIQQLQLAPVGPKRVSYYVFDAKVVRAMRLARTP